VRIVAVDSFGSVIFGGSPGRRMIPGLGMTVRPPLLDESYVDEVVRVEEADTIRACHRLARRGFLFGGSTGTVVSGAMDWLSRHDASDLTAVAIAPDLGERYLDTVYQTNWIEAIYGKDVLSSDFDVPVQAVHQTPSDPGGRDGKSGRDPYRRAGDQRRGNLAEMLADVMKIEQVPFDSHFFDDLGADSLVMAKFCARVRKREACP
jgi:Cysteine synthase